MKLDQSLYTILQILSVSLFEKTPIRQVFREEFENNINTSTDNQLIIFD